MCNFFVSFSVLLLVLSVVVYFGYNGLKTIKNSENVLYQDLVIIMEGFVTKSEIEAQSELIDVMLMAPKEVKDQVAQALAESDQKIDQAFQRWEEMTLTSLETLEGAENSIGQGLGEWKSVWEEYKNVHYERAA